MAESARTQQSQRTPEDRELGAREQLANPKVETSAGQRQETVERKEAPRPRLGMFRRAFNDATWAQTKSDAPASIEAIGILNCAIPIVRSRQLTPALATNRAQLSRALRGL